MSLIAKRSPTVRRQHSDIFRLGPLLPIGGPCESRACMHTYYQYAPYTH